jgi:hypothetical protein
MSDIVPDPSIGLYPEPKPAPEAIPKERAPSQTIGQLPLIYHAAAQARTAGYSWNEINDRFTAVRSAATEAGYADADVDKAFGLSPSVSKVPAPAGLEGLNLHPDTADNIRAFGNKYFTPSFAEGGEPTPPPQGAGDFAKMLGQDVVDIGKIFGGGVVNGLAAIAEGLDGKPKSLERQVQLGIEAQPALGLFAMSPDMLGATGNPGSLARAAKVRGAAALRDAVPPLQETLDAAASVAKAHAEGLTPDTLSNAAAVLGQHFVDTGETPLATATRAANDPTVMAQIHEAMTPRAPPIVPKEPPPFLDAAGDFQWHEVEPLDAAGAAKEAEAIVREPGYIPQTETIPSMSAVPEGTPAPPPPPNAGGFRLPSLLPEMAINPETIGQSNPQLGAGLSTDFLRIFSIQSLDRTGAGIIRHGIARTQAAFLRSAENLRRFGRAVMDTPSDARRAWWHAFEGGEEVPLTATDFAGQAQEMLNRAGLPPEVSIQVLPITNNRPGFRTAGYYVAASRSIVIDTASDRTTVAHEISHAIYDPANGILTDQQRAVMDVRANRWLNQKSEQNPDVTNREMLKALGYPDRQLTEEGMARLIGENPKVTNARDALARYKGQPLGMMGEQLRAELDRRYLRMSELGIAPNYIENYLPRLYQDPVAALKIFGKRPLAGTRVFTRERVFEYLKDAEDAGMKLATDNPVEATLIRLHDMDKFITFHEILNDFESRGLAVWGKTSDRIPEGMAMTDPRISRNGKVAFLPEASATMLNRYLAPGWAGNSIYDAARGASALFTSLKLAASLYHPIVLTVNAIADQAALALVQGSRGGIGNMMAGVARLAKSPVAPFEDFFTGRKIINYAKTGANGTPELARLTDAIVASGGRLTRTQWYQASAAGSFWSSIKGSLVPSSGLMTLPQDIAAAWRMHRRLWSGTPRSRPPTSASWARCSGARWTPSRA